MSDQDRSAASPPPVPAIVTLAITPTPPSPPRRSLATFLNDTKLLAITLVWVVVAGLLVWNAGAIGRVLDAMDVSQIEAFGVKVNISSEKSRLVSELKAQNDRSAEGGFTLNTAVVAAALKRAEINAGAVRGSRLLWVDDEPQNNAIVVDLLSSLGINVIAVTSNSAAMAVLSNLRVDAIVTDGSRGNDAAMPRRVLRRCPLTYRDLPSRTSFADVASLNRAVAAGDEVRGGFRLAERIAAEPATAGFARFDGPRIIMYSASNGDVSYDPCFRAITRDTGRLLHAIISVLEETRTPAAVAPSARDGAAGLVPVGEQSNLTGPP